MTQTAKPRTVPAEECVVRDLIDLHARQTPDRTFIDFESEESWSFAALQAEVQRCAAGLQRLGVGIGDMVMVWLPNGPAAVRAMFAINYLGAVCVPLNLSYRGQILEHVIRDSGGRLLFTTDVLLERLAGIELGQLETVIVVGEGTGAIGGVQTVQEAEILAAGAEPTPPVRPIEPWDTQFVLYTSGTTGPSKGVLSSYLHRHAQAWATTCLEPGERRYIHGPLSHTGGAGAISTTLCKGGSVFLAESFKTDRFWKHVHEHRPQLTALMGATIAFLLKQPPSPEDRNHSLKGIIVAPVDENAIAFGKRFGVGMYGMYSMTELSIPLLCGPELRKVGECGAAPRPGVQIKIVDENDIEVADGQSGELVVRCNDPWVMTHGYLNNPTATAKAWQNGWFHTGDLFLRDADGDYIFIDRMKDVVRRRGENISSFEVETAISLFPGVREVAIVAAKSELSEDEVLAIVSPVPGTSIEYANLIEFLRLKLPHFMIPRYVRVMAELPKTATAKIMKAELRSEGITPDTWDREAHGITVRADRVA